ncbi:MAG: hypothetical protein K5634_03240 [Sphaerochaetaceae bacterium]|nr:hypothetical protein [Sphaerochaetaceae bacterium]
MKILFLTCSTGGGHNSAAKALAEEASSRGCSCTIKNTLDFVSFGRRIFISKGHEVMYKYAPGLYGLLYDKSGEKSSVTAFKSFEHCAGKLHAYLMENGYDAVVCVHVFAAMMMTHVKKQFDNHVKFYLVATDYSFTPGSSLTTPEKHFVPVGLSKEFAAHGIDRDLITETGIPVRKAFYEKTGKKEARESLDLNPDSVLILLSAGSMGCGHLKRLAKSIAKITPQGNVAVLCGNNKRLHRQLSRKKNIMPVAFTTSVPQWFCAADVILTKAGGLTTTEAAISETPLVIMNAVPGLEIHNLDFFENNHLARCAHTRDMVCPMVEKALSDTPDTAYARKKKESTKIYFGSRAASAIIDKVIEGTA